MCTTVPPLAPSQGRLVSRYGVRAARRPPHAPTFHAGIDLGISGAPVGTVPVYCVADGTVAVLGRNEEQSGGMNGYGNCVAIRHPDGLGAGRPCWSFYAHMQRHSPELLASIGGPIRLGTVIGFVGNSTNGKFPGMGPHLHFEIRHATADGGGTPYPGPYPHLTAAGLNNPLNVDPLEWLTARGVRFGPRGVIVPEPPLACDPSQLGALALR